MDSKKIKRNGTIMKKILNCLMIGEYRRDMSKEEKSRRDNKIFLLLIALMLLGIFAFAPLHAESIANSKKFQTNHEWICPNKNCRYDNYDGIRYCGLCGTERGSRSR